MNLEDLEKENLLGDGKTAFDAKQILNPPGKQTLPWIAKLLLGAGGWLTAIFLVALTMILMDKHLSSDKEVAAFVGVIYLAASILISRCNDHPFLSQLTLAIGTAGLALVVFGLWETGEPEGQISFAVTLLLCPAIYFLAKNEILKYLSIIAIFITWWIFQVANRQEMVSSIVPVISIILTALFFSGIIKTRFWRPALLGLISGVFFLLYLPQIPIRYFANSQVFDYMIVSAVISLSFGAATWNLVQPETIKVKAILIGFAAILFLIGYFGSPGIAASLGVIITARARHDATLKWFGILGLTVFVISFYYFLGTPLLSKAWLLLGTGAFLLVSAAAIHYFTENQPEKS